MQTCRRLQSGGGSRESGQGPVYLTVAEGSFVRIDPQSNLQDEAHPYVVYT